jgi:hypothetical protein
MQSQSTQACQQEKGRVTITALGSADDPYRVVLNLGNRLVLNGEILHLAADGGSSDERSEEWLTPVNRAFS